MSTKKIEEAIEALQRYADADGHDGYWNLALTARQDLEAIQRACARIAGGYIKVRASDDEDDAHVALLDTIGEEASNAK